MAVLFTINYRKTFPPRASLDEAIGNEFLECIRLEREALREAHEDSEKQWSQDISVMKRLLDRDGRHLFDDRRAWAQFSRERRKCFLEYLELLRRESRAAFFASVDHDIEVGVADLAELTGRRLLRERSLARLRWQAVKHALGASIDERLVEGLANLALFGDLSRRVTQ